MLALLDEGRVRRFGRWRLLVLLAAMSAMLYLGAFAAIGAVWSGEAIVSRGLVAVSLVFGVALTAVLGRPLWWPPKRK